MISDVAEMEAGWVAASLRRAWGGGRLPVGCPGPQATSLLLEVGGACTWEGCLGAKGSRVAKSSLLSKA